ncbi:MAG: type II secretion system protein GspG [Thermoanaerobaculales bacterium]|nr:type II secretion system protein GspG [Thermoanaerobaculales bacterium]
MGYWIRLDRIALVLVGVVCFAVGASPIQAAPTAQSSTEKTASDLRVWNTAMGMAFLDHGQYPQTQDIFALAAFLQQQNYWEAPIVRDPWGQPYRCDSSSGRYTVWSVGPDGLDETHDDLTSSGTAPPSSAATSRERRLDVAPKGSRGTGRVGNTLTATKSGDDVVLTWAPTGTTYDVVGSSTAEFLNPYVLSQQASTTHTYVGALSSGRDLEFFDVTDETETNRGEDGAGNLPPPPPTLDPLPGGSALVIGATGSLTGTGFSDLAEDNLICFAGGICLAPDTATQRATQLDFTVPPGAVSSSIALTNGLLQSDPISVDIHLESPRTGNPPYARVCRSAWRRDRHRWRVLVRLAGCG